MAVTCHLGSEKKKTWIITGYIVLQICLQCVLKSLIFLVFVQSCLFCMNINCRKIFRIRHSLWRFVHMLVKHILALWIRFEIKPSPYKFPRNKNSLCSLLRRSRLNNNTFYLYSALQATQRHFTLKPAHLAHKNRYSNKTNT